MNQKENYWEMLPFQEIYLEDSYLLDIVFKDDQIIEFVIEAVIKEESSHYTQPIPGEKYCYKNAKIVFSNVQSYAWVEKVMRLNSDSSEIPDYGNIDCFYKGNDTEYILIGDWGHIEIHANQEPTLEFMDKPKCSE
jgi:hypothetical protein